MGGGKNRGANKVKAAISKDCRKKKISIDLETIPFVSQKGGDAFPKSKMRYESVGNVAPAGARK